MRWTHCALDALRAALQVGAIVEYFGEDPKSTTSTGDVLLVQNVGWPKDWFGIVTGFLGTAARTCACLRCATQALRACIRVRV